VLFVHGPGALSVDRLLSRRIARAA